MQWIGKIKRHNDQRFNINNKIRRNKRNQIQVSSECKIKYA